MFALLLLGACDSQEIYFENPVKGRNPNGLTGDYEMLVVEGDTSYTDTISFERIEKSEYTITQNRSNTLYSGEIKKRRGDYYLNQFKSENQTWEIAAFRIANDSIYNAFPGLTGTTNVDIVEVDYFENERKTETDNLTTYYIKNKQRETVKAFSKILDQSKGYSFKAITEKSSTPAITNTDDIELDTDQWSVYPNPCSDHLSIDIGAGKTGTIQLINLSGEVVKTEPALGEVTQLDMNGLPSGGYLVRFISSNGKAETVKLVKE